MKTKQAPFQYENSKIVFDACCALASKGIDIPYGVVHSALILSQLIPRCETPSQTFNVYLMKDYPLMLKFVSGPVGGILIALKDGEINVRIEYPSPFGGPLSYFKKAYPSGGMIESLAATHCEIWHAIWSDCKDEAAYFDPLYPVGDPRLIDRSSIALPPSLTFSVYMRAVILYSLLPPELQKNFQFKPNYLSNSVVLVLSQNHGNEILLVVDKERIVGYRCVDSTKYVIFNAQNVNSFTAAQMATAAITYHMLGYTAATQT